jgi:hypothetical protein
VHYRFRMKRSITSSVLVFAITALIGTALNVYADAKVAKQTAPQGSVNTRADVGGYWAL